MDYLALPPDKLFAICVDARDPVAWEEFIRRFNPVIASVVLRVAIRYGKSAGPVIDDLVQETYLRICANDRKLLKKFVPRHPESTFAYLKVVASSVAHDYFKTWLAQKRKVEATAEVLDDEVTSVSSEKRQGSLAPIERGVLLQQIDQKLGSLLPPVDVSRARTVFWLYYRSGFTAEAISSLPAIGLTTKGVESLLFRLTKLLRESLTSMPTNDPPGAGKGIQQAESF